jgi:hypothetical protein
MTQGKIERYHRSMKNRILLARQKAKSPLVTSRAPEEGTPSMRHQDGQGSVRQDVLGCSAE